MKKVNRILDSMISDIDKVKLGLYEASTKRKKQKFFYKRMIFILNQFHRIFYKLIQPIDNKLKK